jgi:hypothetical protein
LRGDDPKELARRGYDALSWRYRADDADDGNYGPWLTALCERLPAGAATYRAWLEAAGLRVTAEDFVPEGEGGHALFWARRPEG